RASTSPTPTRRTGSTCRAPTASCAPWSGCFPTEHREGSLTVPRELLLPELAESVVEGEIVKWLVPEGGAVAKDQPVVEVMTDTGTVERPSPFASVIAKHLAAEGDVVKVHQAIALIAEPGEGGAEAPAVHRERPSGGAKGAEDRGDELSLLKPGDP